MDVRGGVTTVGIDEDVYSCQFVVFKAREVF